MESTAALIPFDRLFKFTAAELNDEYRVNLFKKVKEENAELLGMFGEEAKEAESEAEADESEKDDEDEKEVEKDNEELSEKDSEGQSEKKQSKKKSKKVSRKMRELEYDYDDPFIDDSEITDVYQSVFELMRGGGDGYEKDEANEDEKDEKSTVTKMSAKKERNFFVYRGTMTPEILAKEFEIDVEELFEAEEGGVEEREAEEGEERGEKRVKKRKVNSESSNATKKVKAAKPAKPLKPAKPVKPVKVTNKKKTGDLIAQSAKKFNDLFSSEDANEKAAVVFNVSGVDANLLELREVLKRFRDLAVGTPFSPGKFPSALRPRLNESICAVLRLCRPTPTALFPAKLFPALASFLPFSPAALNKLLTRKILGPLMEGIEKNEVPKMYETWRKMVERRIMEGGFIEVPKGTTEGTSATTAVTTDGTNDTVGTIDAQISTQTTTQTTTETTTQTTNATSPMKRRLKLSDEMRQQVFEIVRLESDLNNLICLSNLLEAAASTENSGNAVIRSVQSELNLRKIVYQKLVNLSTETMESGAVPLLSTTEISKEFGAQKRKHEKKVSKAASEILFGEAEVEELLKELDVRKETVPTDTPVTETVASTQADPLNLFATEDQSNTSLFIESNN